MTAVKYCGITRIDDAVLAAELGAAAVGLILWPGSPRAVEPSRARAIAQALPPFVTPVLVMVSPTLDDVRRAVEEIGTGVVQLHGPLELEPFLDESWSIVRAATAEQLDALAVDARATLLLDASDPERHGGTGTTIDWAWAARAAAARRVVLAGGLRPENVARAIHEVRPYAVDVASGVEVSPGVKDPRRMRAFAASVREADARKIERAV